MTFVSFVWAAHEGASCCPRQLMRRSLAGFRREGVEVGGAECGDAVGVISANICCSRPGKPSRIVGKMKGRLVVSAVELFRLLLRKLAALFERREVSFS